VCRVQVLLEDWHYQYLRNLAERKKTATNNPGANSRNIDERLYKR